MRLESKPFAETRRRETPLTRISSYRLNDTIPLKRISLSMRLNTSSTTTNNSLFALFLRFPDHLVSTAHFRPEALRKIKTTREDEQRKIRKVDEDEKAGDRLEAGNKAKREERERKLGRMTDLEQKKFLDKEREKEKRKEGKRRTARA